MSSLDRIEYARALEIQRDLVRRRVEGELPDLVWYLEHEPVVTWGSKGGAGHLRRPAEEIEARGIAVIPTDRGGDITYHGPGQLVGYPIIDLGEVRDLHRYLRALEEALIRALGDHGISGERVAGRTGVWVGGKKIAAIGVRVSRWVTSHGFALNVDGDLGGFDLIVPCGIADAGVTSMARELAREGRPAPGTKEAADAVHRRLEEVMGRPLVNFYGKDPEILGSSGICGSSPRPVEGT
jgi:lipoyl(octanoyl) transferase